MWLHSTMPEGGHESENRARTRRCARSRDVFASPPLRRLQLAWAGSVLGGWAYLVALGVYAYDQGGAAAVGLVGLIRMIPAAIAAPFTATLADRFSRVTVMVASDVDPLRADARRGRRDRRRTGRPPSSTCSSRRRPSPERSSGRRRRRCCPRSSRTPNELTAANVASSTIESIGTFLGPALGGLLLAVSSPEVVFAANGLTFLWSAALVLGLRGLEQPRGSRAAGGRGRAGGGRARRDRDDRARAEPPHARRALRGPDPRRRRAQRARRRHLVRAARPRRRRRRPPLRRGRRRRARRRVRRAAPRAAAGGWPATSRWGSRSSGSRSR